MVLWMASLKMVSGRLPVRSPMFGVRRLTCFGNRMKMLPAREIPAHLNTTTAPIFPTPVRELADSTPLTAGPCFVWAATCSSSRLKHFTSSLLLAPARDRAAKRWRGGIRVRLVAIDKKDDYETKLLNLPACVLVHLCVWRWAFIARIAAPICSRN